MMISTEQTRAVMHGIGDPSICWSVLDRPVGPQPIPDWCKGVHVYWADGYANSPSVTLKVHGNVRHWQDKRFRLESGGMYRAYHADGRLEQYGHSGAVTTQPIQMFRSADGTLRQNRRCGAEWGQEKGIGFIYPDGVRHAMEPGEFVQVPMLATTRQEGFGGSHTHVQMEDGREIVLRGPWHCGSPKGYAEVAYVDVTEPDRYWKRGRRWHDRTACGGLYITDDLFVRVMSRFAAHLPLAVVTYGGATTTEPFKPEWGEPKRLVYEREWQARRAAHEAAKAAAH